MNSKSRLESGRYGLVVKAVVFKKDKVLLLKRKSDDIFAPGEWDLPGGKLEHGEKPEDGLHREVMEEAGVKIKIITPFNTFYWFSKLEDAHKVALNYITEYISGKAKESHEHEFAKWYDIDKIPHEATPWIKEAVAKADKIRRALGK